MTIGKHLAVLNLFREPDDSVEITVAGGEGAIGEGAIGEWNSGTAFKIMQLPKDARPIDYIEELIVEAAANMKARRES